MDKVVFQSHDLDDKSRDVYSASLYWLSSKVISWGHQRIPKYFGGPTLSDTNDPNQSLTDSDLSQLASEAIPYDRLEPFATQFLGINYTEWKNTVQLRNTTFQEKIVECLSLWRNKQNPKEARVKLYKLLCDGSKKGWFDRSSFIFLAYDAQVDDKRSKYNYIHH